MADKNFRVKNGLEVGNNFTVDAADGKITLAQNALIQYDEAGNRNNRPNFQSSSGNTSGVRVVAPNATTSALASVGAFSTNDLDNGKFINIRARGDTTYPLGIQIGSYSSGTLGSAGASIAFTDNATTFATLNPSGPSATTDLTTKSYVDSAAATATSNAISAIVDGAPTALDTLNELAAALGDDANYAATITTALGTKLNTADFTSTANTWLGTKTTSNLTEGTNLYYTTARANSDFDTRLATKSTTNLAEGTNLYYTDARARAAVSVTDSGGDGSLAYDNSTGVITYTGPSATEVRAHFSGGTGVTITDGVVAIGQSVGTGDSPTFGGVSAGNISVGVSTDNTITSTNTNGNLVLAANGTGDIVLSTQTRLQGEMQASTNLNYTFPPQTLSTITDNNGYSAASSFPAGSLGYGANMTYTSYYGDTFAGNNTSPALTMRNANGNSVTGDTVPFTGLTSVAPSATLSTEVMGTLNFNGYGTTGFTNDTATQYQGGGINALHSLQIQAYPVENFSDSTLTLSAANITAVASSFRAALGSPSVTGTKGQISFTSTTPGVGNAIRVTGTLTGTATGIVSGNTYYIVVTNGSTTATLSATPGGPPITTTAGTLTGLTLTRCGVTFTLSGQTSVPFGRGALVAITGVNNLTDGTYPVFGAPTTTSVSLGVPHTVAPTLSGTQTFSCQTSYMASGYRIRTFPLATPGNIQNRVNLIDHTAAAATQRSNSFTWAAGGYGTSGATFATLDANEFKPSVPIRPATTAAGNFAGGSTYTPAATITNGVSATINSGTGGFTIALTNLLSAGESGHYQFYVNNTSGSAQQVTTTGGVVNTNHNLASGSSMMITVYIVDTAAFCEHIV